MPTNRPQQTQAGTEAVSAGTVPGLRPCAFRWNDGRDRQTPEKRPLSDYVSYEDAHQVTALLFANTPT